MFITVRFLSEDAKGETRSIIPVDIIHEICEEQDGSVWVVFKDPINPDGSRDWKQIKNTISEMLDKLKKVRETLQEETFK